MLHTHFSLLRRYNFGWSYGKEKLESGKLDTFKGSYYANPVLDVPTIDSMLVNRYPSYCRPNISPTDHLPELEVAFKALGKLILEVGLMLTHHCDRYDYCRSQCHKGRLLYYFPRQFRSCSRRMSWLTKLGKLLEYYQEVIYVQPHTVCRHPAVKLCLVLNVVLPQCSCNQIGMRSSSFQAKSPITKS